MSCGRAQTLIREGSVVFTWRQFEARRAFGDMRAMYDLRSADGRELVTAAAELLVAGIAGPSVVELASEVVTPLTSPFEIDALIGSARDELGMPTLDAEGGVGATEALDERATHRSGDCTLGS